MGATTSPCIRQCGLDDREICLGCFRSLAEIVAWPQVNDHQRREFCNNATRRRLRYQALQPEANGA